MASGSPRNRIDQFFASKKRKSSSPHTKSRRADNNEGSPSAKGTLDNYLRNSQEGGCVAKPLHTVSDYLSVGHDSVKRNLLQKAEKNFKPENKQVQLSAEVPKIEEAAQKEASHSLSDLEHAAAPAPAPAPAKDCLLPANGTENLELKQFTNDFLSLYCSEIQSSLPADGISNGKRRDNPSLVDEESQRSNKRFQMTGQSQVADDYSFQKGKATLERVPCSVSETRKHASDSFKEEPVADNLIELQASLKKCKQPPPSTVGMVGCSTPVSLVVKSSANKTPSSTCGSSMFSPGEGFWSEAIKLADGFCAPANHSTSEAFEEDHLAGKVCQPDRSDHEENEGTLHDRNNRVYCKKTITSESVEKHTQGSLKKVSPLPVKHFDFSCEDKSFDKVIVNSSDPQYLRAVTCRDDNQIDCESAGPKGLRSTSTLARCSNRQKTEEIHENQPMVPSDTLIERKADLFSQNDGSSKSDSPMFPVKNLSADLQNGEACTPSSVQNKDNLDISNWLPPAISSLYRKKGILRLYQWQVDCLQVEGVLQRKNLVYCASTSAGKSFVAEILMLRRVLSTGKIALLVLPYVSICTEKAEHLEALLEPLGKHVRSYYGSQGGGTLPKDTSVAVCTIEKGNSLINRLLEEGRLSEIGIVVIDELHMVGDRSRGYLLELMLTKLRYAAGEGNSDSSSGESSNTSSGKADPARGLQIVGMSATMPNVAAVADWLQAALYQTDFRPVPLEEYIKVGNTIYNKKMDIIRTISKAAELGGKDPDHIVELCNEVVQEGHSILIFCSSRKGCESTARHVTKFLRKFSVNLQNSDKFTDIAAAIDALRRSPAGLDPTLEETLPSGVAYHHAGLTVEEREIVETCYRRGLLRVLTATSTLAAGVNLPARRVIFRQPRIGRDFIDGTRYKQMAGRAGRTGIDTKGESILICRSEEVKRIVALLNESCPPLNSCLSEDKNGMTHAILEVVAGGIVQTANDINRYVRCTLLNSTKPFQDVVKSAQDSLRWLCYKKFLEWNEETKLYSTTPLGRAAFGSSLSPDDSLIVLEDLSRAREGFVLASDLHLVYLVTPTNVDVEPDWELYYQRFMELSALDQSVGNRVGVSEPFLMRMAHGAPMRTIGRSRDSTEGSHCKLQKQSGISNNHVLPEEKAFRVCKRFYVALILARLVQEAPVAEVCEAYKVARGMVQALQENAGRFASMVSVFCERLGWHDLEGLVGKFQNRVSFGVRAEIVELTNIPYVKGSRARALYKAGLRTPLAIAEASTSEIVKALFEYSSWAAEESSAQRRLQVGVAKKIKNGARKIVLDKAEEARIAAFSAFQSLGLDIMQFSRPVPTMMGNHMGQGHVRMSSGVETTDNMSDVKSLEHVLPVAIVGESKKSDRVAETRRDTLETKSFDGSNALETLMLTSGNANYHAANVPPFLAEDPVAVSDEPTVATICGKDADTTVSIPVESHGDKNRNSVRTDARVDCSVRTSVSSVQNKDCADKGPVTAVNIPGGIDTFLNLWDATNEFYFDIHYTKRKEVNSVVLFEICGLALCWENSPVYYINLPKDLVRTTERKSSYPSTSSTANESSLQHAWMESIKIRWNRICGIMEKKSVRKFTWNLKVQIQVFRNSSVSVQRIGRPYLAGKDLGPEIIDNSYLVLPPVNVNDGIDICVVAWILWPDEEKSSCPSLEKEVKKRLPSEVAAAAHRCGRWKNQMRKSAHDGCCRRVAQTRALHSVLWKLLIDEKLFEPLMMIEVPLVKVIAYMELWGVGVDLEGCLQAHNILGQKLRLLEKEAHRLAGISFSLYAAADIANVLYRHLKLPVPEVRGKGKLHPSTDKHCLDLLRNEHPIIPIIKEHRTLAKLRNCTLGSICSLSRLSTSTQKYTLHGHWLQTSTATGRLSMEEPNLQCVEHVVEFKMNTDKNAVENGADHHKINARDFIIPTQENWLLLTADYSQIELRLMAHFSEDAFLIELLSKPNGDVFKMIAARWTGKTEDAVSSHERDQTKRMVYGIIYGMGAKTLSEQLDCSPDEATEKIQSFKTSFPGVASWLHGVVSSCRQKGYVETLKGRKRFLSKIKFGNSKEKSKAQRQAVNSICQGSAADIIKIAMINIHSVILGVEFDSSSLRETNFHMLEGRCRILLQVHDELVLEVDPTVLKDAVLLLQRSMENAVSLRVPLNVKLKVGRTWGSLEPFCAENQEQVVAGGS
ncbi:helicase and polymerase-containing protein TEBICHI isoform X1 [Rhodamnia argentea]|uniref:Helicase and polymerase-containing protein TEBICHI isoform X1 n=1 Tax=Rhodamnia argentea TaxID=178133 RepID=A0A8B8Q7G3_9MYRT|nr:helicase and polymerase-containing protein TEBICHI isoform X1 [Rhodamnia argentea]